MFENLPTRFPKVDRAHLAALAEVWSSELAQIIDRMMAVSRDEEAESLPLEAREEAIFELAKLILWLEERIIDKKTSAAPIAEIDPRTEQEALSSQAIQERLENTARTCADQIWKKLVRGWCERYPLLVSGAQKGSAMSLKKRSRPTAKRQHFSPSFSNKYWASGPENQVRVYQRGVDGQIESRDVGYRVWGREYFLYSQKLEDWFRLVEGDAKQPYEKLLNTVPLTEKDRRQWVAFLAVQAFRTPAFISRFLPVLRALVAHRFPEYPTTLEALRRAFETLFTNNRTFASVYRLLTERQWRILGASGQGFVRPDDPVVLDGSVTRQDWQLMYPMTPSRCLAIGPQQDADSKEVVPHFVPLGPQDLIDINTRLAAAARRTVIAQITRDDGPLKRAVAVSLGKEWDLRSSLSVCLPEYWGPLCQ